MQTKPAIPLQHIRHHLQTHYHVRVDVLEFLPIGEGVWCFRFIIDWDNVILAPRERDLMFFVGPGLADYLEGYRRYEANYNINQTLVDYYVLEWALQEIVDYGTRILFDARFNMSGRLDAWQQFQQLFEPGGDIDRAFTLMNSTPGRRQ